MKTIILDFDGTIADTFNMSIEIAHNLTGHASLLNPAEVKELRHDSMIQVAEKLEIPKHMWPFLLYRGRRQMARRLKEIKLFDGIEDVLTKLHNRGYRIFVMSTNSSKNINRFLLKHGLRSYVHKIYGGVGLLGKAGELRKILKQNHLRSDDVIYVGDEVRDIEASKRVNIPIVAVTWGFNDQQRLTKEKPSAIVHTPKQLFEVLESWEEGKDII
ncbi:MAG: HAD hydrolase-like protein [Candidatus Saccharimonadales bacterium]